MITEYVYDNIYGFMSAEVCRYIRSLYLTFCAAVPASMLRVGGRGGYVFEKLKRNQMKSN